jgi:hypothetical protein
LNFDSLGPANWLWGKQYEIYTNIDTGGQRYVEFEKWWGDFIQLNGDELQFLVDNFFIGDKLTRNQLQSRDGTTFDVRNITSPIIVFTSTGDNISPPPQALGFILDLYRDVDDIRATGRTIVYCMDHKIGHLALFVSSKVGAKQDEEFVQLMDVIDCLPPGLYEMVISPRPSDVPAAGFITGDWIARFETRSLDDIRALGRNSPGDDCAFAAVARLSELNLSLYRTLIQPLLWLAIRAGAPRPQRGQRGAAGPRHIAREAGGTTSPGGRIRGDAEHRWVRRNADPGGALRHRGRPRARPAMCARAECRTAAAHAPIAARVQSAGAGPVLCAPTRA